MPFLILMMLYVLSFISALTCLIDNGSTIRLRYRLLFFAAFVGLAVWIIAASSRPWKVDKEEVMDYSEAVMSNGTVIQTLQYIDRDGKPQVLNLNEKFNTRLTAASKVKVKYNSPGPYCGVYYNSTSIMHDDFEIVCPMPDKEKE